MQHFQYIIILLAGAVGVVALFRRIHLPPILGYLSVGMLVGPGGFGFIPKIQNLSFLAEFGVVFLMFTIGLEFSWSRIMTMKRALLGLGGVQVLLCTLFASVWGWFLGLPPKTAFVAAGALALSSTAVVIKQLAEQREINTTHGKFAIGILLFQDLAAVLFLILIPALASGGDSNSALILSILFALAKGICVCIFLGLFGQYLLRPLFHEVAKSHSSELFMLAALLVALSASWLTHYLDLSMALGAFLAGLMLGETEFRHQIEIDIRPFRDVLLGLFFVTIGALLRINTLPQHWYWVIALLISLIAFKTILIMLLTRIVGAVSIKKAFRTGLILAQGGEFGFVILTVAINNDLIDPAQSQVVVAAVVLSIVISPLLIRYNKLIGSWIFVRNKKDIPAEEFNPTGLSTHTAELNEHVIICGFGRVGQILARFLEQENIPSLALDLDPLRISSSSLAGENAFFGDARRPEVLAAAGLARARMIVISFADEPAALETLRHIRKLRLDVPVFVRTKNDSNLKTFQEAGATEVVPESLEASLMLASHLLLTLGVPASRILFKIRAIHSDRYRIIQGFFKGMDDPVLLEETDDARMSLHSVTIAEDSYAIGKTIEEISDPEQPLAIKFLTRGTQRHLDPEPTMTLEEGDVLVLHTTPEMLYVIVEKLLRGPKSTT